MDRPGLLCGQSESQGQVLALSWWRVDPGADALNTSCRSLFVSEGVSIFTNFCSASYSVLIWDLDLKELDGSLWPRKTNFSVSTIQAWVISEPFV